MPDIDILSYFCASQDIDDSCSVMLRTIALQLIRQHPDLTSLVCNEFVYKSAGCVMAQLRVLVSKMLETVSCARLVIDGIDETSKEIQKIVLKELQAVCLGENSTCKILFSSRREVHLADKLADKPQIVLDGRKEVNLDIRLYVKNKIRKLDNSNPDLRIKIENILVEKANGQYFCPFLCFQADLILPGMFLWVHLVIEELRSCFSDWDLAECANSLPKGLEAASVVNFSS